MLFSTSSMAGMMATVEWSHNQGRAGDFWPYNGWYNAVLGGASGMEVPFRNLTEGNIKGIQ